MVKLLFYRVKRAQRETTPATIRLSDPATLIHSRLNPKLVAATRVG